MVAPTQPRPAGMPPEKQSRSPYRWLLLVIVFGFIVFMAFEKFDDFVQRNPDGTYVLKKKRRDQLNDKVHRMREETEQYVLRASKSGYYQCLHCPNGVFFLHANEVWKYGITTQGKYGRYKPQYLRRMGLIYEVQYIGNLQKAMEQELIKIGNYPLLPENLARPDRSSSEEIRYKLARPPGQATDS